jgi:1-acyl-sn-glycerol-3-phosphate acyltransferase
MIVLRSALFNSVFFVLTFLYTLPATAVRLVSPDSVLFIAMFWARTMVLALRIICGIRLEVTGLDRIPPGPALISSRHQSAFDTFIWMTLLPRCCYVLKQELINIPLFGKLIMAARMIPIDREAGTAAIRTLLRESERAVREGRQIVIFPEGTRSEPGRPGAIQAGVLALANRTGLPVIPVATDSGLCWGRRAFRKRPGTIHILIGDPIPPTADRRALARALELGMGALDREQGFGVPGRV